MIRFIIIALVVGFILYLVKGMMKPAEFIRCDRCDGKGFWYGTRGRETCNKCRGEGTVHRDQF